MEQTTEALEKMTVAATTSDLAHKFVTMVENKRHAVRPMEEFFDARREDFASLEMENGTHGDSKSSVVKGEHELVWTEHHAAYMALVEEELGIKDFFAQENCRDDDLLASMRCLVAEKPQVQMFVDSLISSYDYEEFLKLAYAVKKKKHCFHTHLNVSAEKCHGGDGHNHDHNHEHHNHEHDHDHSDKHHDHEHEHHHDHDHDHHHHHEHEHGNEDGHDHDHGHHHHEHGNEDGHDHDHGHHHDHK